MYFPFLLLLELTLCVSSIVPAQSGDWRKAAIMEHNVYRNCHKSPPIKQSTQINASAQKCAEYLASTNQFHHLCGKMFGTEQYGENLYSDTGYGTEKMAAALRATRDWYRENKHYDYTTAETTIMGKAIGHFIQLVWKASTQVGLGVATNGSKVVVVGQYFSRGNVGGQYQANVEPSMCFQSN